AGDHLQLHRVGDEDVLAALDFLVRLRRLVRREGVLERRAEEAGEGVEPLILAAVARAPPRTEELLLRLQPVAQLADLLGGVRRGRVRALHSLRPLSGATSRSTGAGPL